MTVHTGDVPATILYNVLIADPEYNTPILEKLQIPPGDPSGTQVKLFTAVELSHMPATLLSQQLSWLETLDLMTMRTSRTFLTTSCTSPELRLS